MAQRTDIQSKPKYDTSIETDWQKNDIIRNKFTGDPYLVVHVYQHVCTIVLDLQDKSPLKLTYTLTPSEYDNYAKDSDMEVKKNNEWEYHPIFI